MKTYTDPDVFMLEINQIRDKLSDLDEVVSIERLTSIILDALLGKMTNLVIWTKWSPSSA